MKVLKEVLKLKKEKIMNYYKVGDNLESFKDLGDETVDLVYLDPPYNTGRDFGDFLDKFESMQSFRDDF